MKIFLLLAVMAISLRTTAQENNDWVLKNQKDGVNVFFRKKTDIYEIKLTTSFNTTLCGMTQLLSEVEHYATWGYKVTDVRLLQMVAATDFYYYARLDFPWPLNDRDVIMHTKLFQDPLSRRVYAVSESAPDYLPVTDDVVRIRDAFTKWTLFPGAEGWIYTEYEIYSDPGGSIPEWLVNLAIDIGPRETMNNLRTFLKQPEYQHVKLAYIRE